MRREYLNLYTLPSVGRLALRPDKSLALPEMPSIIDRQQAVSVALLQKLPKFLNCEQLFGSHPRSLRATNADKAQGFFDCRGRR